MPGRYLIDYLTSDWRTRCQALACDGERTAKLNANRVWSLSAAGEISPGMRAVTDTSRPLADWNLPTPVKAVGRAAALAAGGAVAVSGWLQKRSAKPDTNDLVVIGADRHVGVACPLAVTALLGPQARHITLGVRRHAQGTRAGHRGGITAPGLRPTWPTAQCLPSHPSPAKS
jgi:hypothetical protein